jgi:hypothetical protein
VNISFIYHLLFIIGGHYVSYVKSSLDHNWYEFDDAQVTEKTEAEIAQIEAYVLFYQRSRSTLKELEQYQILSQIRLLPNQPSCLVSKLWFMKWLFFVHPGPIHNAIHLCEHYGIINLQNLPNYQELMLRIPEPVYQQLVMTYGSDMSTMLHDLWQCQKCEEYEKSLHMRRRLEEKEVAALDSTTLISKGQHWYLIHSEWLRAWHLFKQDDVPPGPISNHALLDEHSQPLKHLRKAYHYRGVNQQVWDYFYQRYGGGPPIIRDCIDIYAPVQCPLESVPSPSLYDDSINLTET